MDRGEKTSPYTRKAPYQYGWNWAPRLVTCGIWRPIALEAWDQARINDFHISLKRISPEVARLTAEIELRSTAAVEVNLMIDSLSRKIERAERQFNLRPGLNLLTIEVVIPKPALWWPNGLGDQPLYDLRAQLRVSAKPIDQVVTRIGLRTLQLEQMGDSWGKSFQFVINGVPIFAKGGNWIPADSFPTRVTPERYRYLLRSCRDANMNMLRVWGGGIYENEEFYNLCDEMGILVWQDFMFGNSLYPADQPFLDSITEEAIDNLKRLRNHPSLALWCGNNESETGWFHWGWKRKLPARFWNDYKRIFHDILPLLCAAYDPSRPYWPSSPSSNLEDDSESQKMGDLHYWDVWNKGLPFLEYKRQLPRFMSEYGFQSFPEARTVSAFTVASDQDIGSPVMLAHQKYADGNRMLQTYILRDYPEPNGFESFLYVSQVLQAEAIKVATEHLRRIMPRCMGSLYWQINDCWPSISWSGIDYFGRWKALHYYARRFYKDILVSPTEENGIVNIHVVSDRLNGIQALLRVTLQDFEGHSLLENRRTVNLPPLKSSVYLSLPKSELLLGKNAKEVLLNCELWTDENLISFNHYFFTSYKNLNLPKPKISAEVSPSKAGCKLRLTSSRFAKDVNLSVDQPDGLFTDNFFDLLPGTPVEIEFQTTRPFQLQEFRKNLRIQSLAEAFQEQKLK